jgi:predicted small metal-binding protein
MTKVVNCRDVGFDCGHVVRAATEEEALKQVVAHVKAVHNVETVLKEVIEKAREEMHDE